MNEIIKNNSADRTEMECGSQHYDKRITNVTDQLLDELHAEHSGEKTISVPVAEIASLGGGVSSLIPAIRKVTQTSTTNADGLYRLANASIGDTLKVAKNGNFWGAFKTAEGKSKFVQLQQAGPLTSTTTTIMPVNPATMMMAVALFSIEQELGNIAKTGKKILSFLEIDKESRIEADVKTLSGIMRNFKYNWDNNLFISNQHQVVLDIQREAMANILAYRQIIKNAMKSRQLLVTQKNVSSSLAELVKKFKYYRLAAFTHSMASMLEVMLSGNFYEEYIQEICRQLEKNSSDYRDLFSECSEYLEKLAGSALDKNLLKGVGTTGKAVGRLIGEIPLVKNGPVDEALQNGGKRLEESAENMETGIIREFSRLSDPGTRMFIARMEDLMLIYNHTKELCFNDKKIVLVAEKD